MSGPGRMPRVRTWIIGGGLLALVLGGYWYFNGRGDSGARQARQCRAGARGGGGTARHGGGRTQPGHGGRQHPGAAERPGAGHAGKRQFQGRPVRQEGRSAVPDRSAALPGGAGPGRSDLCAATRRSWRMRCATSERYATLRQQGAISAQQRDTSETNADVMTATVAADKAAVDMARLNLGLHPDPLAGGRQDRADPDPAGQHDHQLQRRHRGRWSPSPQVRPIKISFTLPQSDLPRIQARQQSQARCWPPWMCSDRAGNVLAAPVDFTSNMRQQPERHASNCAPPFPMTTCRWCRASWSMSRCS